MPLELAAVAFDGAFTAERELNNLRVSRLDPWVGEVAVVERYHGGRYAARGASPDYGGNRSAAAWAAGGGGRGAFIGLLGGLPGLVIGAIIGAVLGLAAEAASSPKTGAFGMLADLLGAALPADSSALLLVAESPAAAEFVSAVAPHGRQAIRHELSDEQLELLRLAASRQ